MAESMG